MKGKLIIGIMVMVLGVFAFFEVRSNDSKVIFPKNFQQSSLGSVMIGGNTNNKSETSNTNLKRTDPDILNTWEMPDELFEISGLSFIDRNRIACIQDEEGIIFVYNLDTRNVESKTQFEGRGDFEDLAIVDNTAWVIRSDGHLFEIENYTNKDAKAKEFETSLSSKNNVEGLCYDQKNQRLLLSVKDRDDNGKNVKGIYSFDLVTKKFNNLPVYKIDTHDEIFGSHKSKNDIRPSAISINPESGDIYVLDGPAARLLILGTDSKVKKLIEFDHNKFHQAEGITFSPEGKMYISNEGYKKTPGNILEVVLK